ncbi:IS3 family transposase [Bacillus thuringiensis]|uniref:IS3 family transposase n=1 Tax=Bacillus TaxID=1386 RepID=UPI000D566383|nr:IS3 family transposase [Bacillus thuringiensis]MBD8071825.1 transposase [Bacillus thuringiensis]MCU4859991.1 IS3 family transposase [Bacillus cereus]QQP78258.1 transposase [Bacillus sp. TK-2]
MNNIRLESDKRLKKLIQSIHLKHKEYGYPRMKIALEEEDYFINHKKVYRLMSELNIQSIIRKKRRFFKGNYSNTFPNVLNREFKDRQQNEALVTDITYLRFQEDFRYLSVVQAIEEYIYFYNYKRFQKRLNHRAPIEYRISMAA